MSDEEFLQSVENCALPLEEWKHRAHLKIAYLYLRRFPFDEALGKVRAGIKRYNAATNTPVSLDRGYHETITQAWVRLVDFTIRQQGSAPSADEFLEANPQLLHKNALRFFYSREAITTWQAKADFVEPDLTPLPKPNK